MAAICRYAYTYYRLYAGFLTGGRGWQQEPFFFSTGLALFVTARQLRILLKVVRPRLISNSYHSAALNTSCKQQGHRILHPHWDFHHILHELHYYIAGTCVHLLLALCKHNIVVENLQILK